MVNPDDILQSFLAFERKKAIADTIDGFLSSGGDHSDLATFEDVRHATSRRSCC